VQGAVYFVQGSADASRSRQWMRKRQMLLEGTPGEIAFSEEELNSWLSSGAPKKDKKPARAVSKPTTPAKPGAPKAAPPAEIPEDLLVLETPNVRIRDSIFQIGVPGSLNLLTFSLPIVLQSQGNFEKSGDVWVFKPSTFYLGSMPLHRIPGFTDQVVKRLMSSSLVPEDALASWKRVSEVAVDGKALKITIPAVAAPAPAAVESATPETHAPPPAPAPTSAPAAGVSTTSETPAPASAPTSSSAAVESAPPETRAPVPASTSAPAAGEPTTPEIHAPAPAPESATPTPAPAPATATTGT